MDISRAASRNSLSPAPDLMSALSSSPARRRSNNKTEFFYIVAVCAKLKVPRYRVARVGKSMMSQEDINNLSIMLMLRNGFGNPPLPPFPEPRAPPWGSPEWVDLMMEQKSAYKQAVGTPPPCSLLKVSVSLIRVTESGPSLGLLIPNAWTVQVGVAQMPSHPDAQFSFDLGFKPSFPVDVPADYVEYVRVEVDPWRGPPHPLQGLLFFRSFEVWCGGWVNPGLIEETRLPSDLNVHGGSGWGLGMNTLTASELGFSYEVHYSVECAPQFRSVASMSNILNMFFARDHKPEVRASQALEVLRFLERGHHLVARDLTTEKDPQVTFDGPLTIRQVIDSSKGKKRPSGRNSKDKGE